MLVSDILNVKKHDISGMRFITLSPESSMVDAVRRMSNDRVSCIVVKDGERFQGLITFREIVAGLDMYGGDLLSLSVAEIMKKNPITACPADSVFDVRRSMIDKHCCYLPVIQETRLVDVISSEDLSEAAYVTRDFENRLLKNYIKHWPESTESVAR